jgi:hypothetical protein
MSRLRGTVAKLLVYQTLSGLKLLVYEAVSSLKLLVYEAVSRSAAR